MARRRDKAVRAEEDHIVRGWLKVSKEHDAIHLNDEEKAQIDRARLADEQAKRSVFTLGGSFPGIILKGGRYA